MNYNLEEVLGLSNREEKNGIAALGTVKKHQESLMQDDCNHLFGTVTCDNGAGTTYVYPIGLAYDGKISERNHNVCVIGCTGSGKSYNYVMSNLLQGNHSAIVLDKNGEFSRQFGSYWSEKDIGEHVLDLTKGDAKDLTFIIKELTSRITVLFVKYDIFNDKSQSRVNSLIPVLYAKLTANGCLSIPVQFYLDEFRNFDFKDMICMAACARKYNIGFSLLVQSVTQLAKVFPNGEYETLLGNCDTIVFQKCVSLDDAEFVRKLCGKYLYDKKSDTGLPIEKYGRCKQEKRFAKDYETRYIIERDVISAEDAMKIWRDNDIIVAIRNCYPFVCKNLEPAFYED